MCLPAGCALPGVIIDQFSLTRQLTTGRYVQTSYGTCFWLIRPTVYLRANTFSCERTRNIFASLDYLVGTQDRIKWGLRHQSSNPRNGDLNFLAQIQHVHVLRFTPITTIFVPTKETKNHHVS